MSQIAQLSKEIWKPGDGEFPYIGLEHIEEGKLRLNGTGNSNAISSNKFLFENNSFLFGKLRPYFRKVVRPEFHGVCSTDIWVVKAKKTCDLDFLFYLFANQDFIDLAYSGSSGTKMPRADWDFLKDTKWNVPKDINEQKAIAGVLSALDNKIDLLHRQNQTLEVLTQTLFRHLFIEKLENDWEEFSLSDVVDIVGGGTPKTNMEEYWGGEINWLSGGDITKNHKNYVISTEKLITKSGLENSSTKIVPKFSTVISARGTVGKYCILAKPMAFSQTNYGILPKYKNCFFFTYLIINHSVTELISGAYGSVFDTITTKTFDEYHIKLPPAADISSFEEKVKPFFLKMEFNQNQIQTLEKLRDLLLPKLMSGEVRVRYDQDH